jgi:hypothetical protein
VDKLAKSVGSKPASFCRFNSYRGDQCHCGREARQLFAKQLYARSNRVSDSMLLYRRTVCSSQTGAPSFQVWLMNDGAIGDGHIEVRFPLKSMVPTGFDSLSSTNLCGYGGIGIRASLRGLWGKTCAGSTPVIRTNVGTEHWRAHLAVTQTFRLWRFNSASLHQCTFRSVTRTFR